MDWQVRGQLATITFALGKLIRSTSRTAEQRQDEVERLRSWADHQLKEAYRAGADSAGLTPEQQAFLSGVHDTVDQLAWLIDSPVYPQGQTSGTSAPRNDDPSAAGL